MRLGNTVEFTHVALGLIPEILNAIDVIVAICEELRMVDTEEMEVRRIQHIIAGPAVGINDAVRDHLDLSAEHRLALSLQFVGNNLAAVRAVVPAMKCSIRRPCLC